MPAVQIAISEFARWKGRPQLTNNTITFGYNPYVMGVGIFQCCCIITRGNEHGRCKRPLDQVADRLE